MKLNIPDFEQELFATLYTVTISDINYGGHVGNDRFLSIAHEARVRWYQSMALSEKNIGENCSTIMANAIVNYQSEVFQGEEIRIAIGVSKIGKSSFDLVYVFSNSENKPVAKLLTTIVSFDYERRKARRLPVSFIKRLQD